jgi:hypothetical protein
LAVPAVMGGGLAVCFGIVQVMCNACGTACKHRILAYTLCRAVK